MSSFAGTQVVSIRAVEQALVQVASDGFPQFRHEQIPFIQCVFVDLQLEDGRFAHFSIYQNDTVFGVMLEFRAMTSVEAHWSESHRDGEPSIYRVAPDLNWTFGRIERVETRLDDGDISEVELVSAARNLLLKAGEVYEGKEGALSVSEMDECILLFPDERDIARATFNPKAAWIPIVERANPKTS